MVSKQNFSSEHGEGAEKQKYQINWASEILVSRLLSPCVAGVRGCTSARHLEEGFIFCIQITALHQGLFKYLTAEDICDTPTITKHDRSLFRLGNLLLLQPRSMIKGFGSFSEISFFGNKLYTSELFSKFRHHLMSEITI